MNKFCIVFLVLVLSITSVFAGSLEESLKELTDKAATEYVGPLNSAIGANLNTGWFNGTPKAKVLGLTAELSFVSMISDMSGKDSFSVESRFSFSRGQAEEIVDNSDDVDVNIRDLVIDAILEQEFDVVVEGPTIIGDEDQDGVILFDDESITIDVDGVQQVVQLDSYGLDLPIKAYLAGWKYFPMVAPQLKLGTVYGTQLTLRGLPPFDYDELGTIKYYGFGIEHNPKVWIPFPIPVDLSLAFFTQTIDIAEIVTTTASIYGITAAKQFGPKLFNITPYAGLMLESSKLTVSYDLEQDLGDNVVEVDKVEFDLEGENSTRFVLGSSFRAGFFKLNLDYNISTYNSASAGISFVF